jgi:hypothetical protein
VTRTTPGLLRLIVLVGLAAFWLTAALVVTVLAAWPAGVLAALAAADGGALATMLGLAVQVWTREDGAATRRERGARASRLHNAA